MTRKFNLTGLFILLVLSSSLFGAGNSEWIVAAQKFSFNRGQSDSVSEGVAQTLPSLILEKLSSGLFRNVPKDELAQRELYETRQNRASLFLQLSSEVKRRDSLVLANYSQGELNRQIAQQEKKINELKEKLKENIEKQKEYDRTYATTTQPQIEKISLYNKNISELFKCSQQAELAGIDSMTFQKEVISAGIRCLITGTITAYQEYMSVSVQARVYPGAKVICYITEIGSIDDADYISSNIARQISPAIVNALPSVIRITAAPEEAVQDLSLYIDDLLFTDINGEITIDSGVHLIQFVAPGYRNCGTTYFFEGDKTYEINVELEKEIPHQIFLKPLKPMEGDFLVNGVGAQKLDEETSQITINGKTILGQFIVDEKQTSFFSLNEKKLTDGALYTVKVKPIDHSEFIEKRRRQMYLSYSMLVTSLVPSIVTKGIVKNYKTVLGQESAYTDVENYHEGIQTANRWILASNICTGVSIACGVWLVYELYRYFKAADSVLPVSTKVTYDFVPSAAESEAPAQEEVAEAAAQEPDQEIVDEAIVIEE